MIGEYNHSLDAKGRINFPAKLREELGDRFYITKGLDNCLFVYSEAEWKVLEERIRTLPVSKARPLQRFLFAGAALAEPDKQGRVGIPQNLREYAGLTKDIVVAGASLRAEIWDKQSWDDMCSGLTSASIAEAMDDLGF